MANDLFQCDVLTPERRVFVGPVRHVLIPAHDGQMGVLVNHAPMLCELGYGLLRLDTDQGRESWYIEGGFAEVTMEKTVILTRSAVRPDQITCQEAEALLEQAREITSTDEVSARRRADLEVNARARLRICGGGQESLS
jgi:F-type H+-transporting ATPase subunit epsilon